MNNNNAMFEELTFIPHRGSVNCIQARKDFDNGCTISVVTKVTECMVILM